MVYGFIGNPGVIDDLCIAVNKVYRKFGYGKFLLSDMQIGLSVQEKRILNIRKLHSEKIVERAGWTEERKPQRLWKFTMSAILYATRKTNG